MVLINTLSLVQCTDVKRRRVIVRVLPSFENTSDDARNQLSQELGYLTEHLSLEKVERDAVVSDAEKRVSLVSKSNAHSNSIDLDAEIASFVLTEAEVGDLHAPFTVVGRRRASPSDTTLHLVVTLLDSGNFEMLKYRLRMAKCLRLESIGAL